MKNTMNVVRTPLQVITALGLLVLLIIEVFRPLTGFPTATTGPVNPAGTPFEVWSPFAAQFAYFTIWTNILFVLTLVVAWIFRAKINSYWKNAVLTYLMVMLIVFFTIIAPYAKWDGHPWLTFMLIWQHLGVVVIGLWWFFTTKSEKTKLGLSTLITITVPLLYIIFAAIIYLVLNVAPYNFLNFRNAFGANLSLPISIILSLVTIIVIGLLVIGFNWLFVIFNNNEKTSSAKSDHQYEYVKSPKEKNTEVIVEKEIIIENKPAKKRKVAKASVKKKPAKKRNVAKASVKKKVVKKHVVAKKPATNSKKKPAKKVKHRNIDTWKATYHHHNVEDPKNTKIGKRGKHWPAKYHHHNKDDKK